MSTVTFDGNPVLLSGNLPAVGSPAPDFTLVTGELQERTLSDFSGRKKLLSIFPSIDTSVCASAARYFAAHASQLKDTVVLHISRDLPFASGRFCTAESISDAIFLSDMRRNTSTFGKDYGIEITDGPLTGLLTRAVVLLDETNKVLYAELVPEITNEPNYAAILQHL